MNDQLQEYARKILKEDLTKCTEDQQLIFKRMYSHKNLELPMSEVVDSMRREDLDWAME